jgi:hypothetical protein
MSIQRITGAALPLVAGLVAFLAAGVPGAAAAAAADEASKSAMAAKELTTQLDHAKLQYVAVRDPEDPTRFVAAMYLPGLQLITVSGKYSVPVLLNEKLLGKKYQDVYLDLSSASDRDSRVVVEDLRADGLPVEKIKGTTTADVYEKGADKLVFDFDWKKQKMSEKDFLDKVAAADAQYTRLLTLLLAEAKKGR